MILEKIMSNYVVTVTMDDRLEKVKEIFDGTGFHHLLVVEEDQLVGVISDRDLLNAISPNIGTINETTQDIETLNKRVHQVMTRKLVTLGQYADIDDAIEIFNTERVSRIPIVDKENKPLGIISWRDILKTLKKRSQ